MLFANLTSGVAMSFSKGAGAGAGFAVALIAVFVILPILGIGLVCAGMVGIIVVNESTNPPAASSTLDAGETETDQSSEPDKESSDLEASDAESIGTAY